MMLAENAPILSRDDLSFTARDEGGRMIGWPRNNPGAPADWETGHAFFDAEISELAAFDENDAFYAIQYAILGMGGRSTCLEIGFVESVARAALLGLRAMRAGAERFDPIDVED